jgi:hypothetical protein
MSTLFRFVLEAIEYKQLTLALRDDVSGAFIPQPTDLPYNKKELRLSRHQAETILDALGDLLCSKGITDGELNTYGLWLEPLIDLVNEPLHR